MLTNSKHLKLIDFGTALITKYEIFDPKTKQSIDDMKQKVKQYNVTSDICEPLLKSKTTFVGTCEYRVGGLGTFRPSCSKMMYAASRQIFGRLAAFCLRCL
jgi:hypothetical protein